MRAWCAQAARIAPRPRVHCAVLWRAVAPCRRPGRSCLSARPAMSQHTPDCVAAHARLCRSARPCHKAHARTVAPCRSSPVTIQGLYRNTSPCPAPYRSPGCAVSRHSKRPYLLPVTIQDFVSRHSLPVARPSLVTIQLIVS